MYYQIAENDLDALQFAWVDNTDKGIVHHMIKVHIDKIVKYIRLACKLGNQRAAPDQSSQCENEIIEKIKQIF